MPASKPPPVKRLEIRNPTVSITILIPKLQDPGSEQNATQNGPVCIPGKMLAYVNSANGFNITAYI